MTGRQQRADAQRNYERILEVARTVVEEQGTQASLRDIARRAEVGMGTLYRHFPTREALLEALLRQRFDTLAARAEQLEGAGDSHEALRRWLQEFLRGASAYRGLTASMMTTIGDEGSALHASCSAMREAAGRLVKRAQDDGRIRPDVDGMDVFALISAVGWIAEQGPVVAERRDHLFSLVLDGLAAGPVSGRARRAAD
ncbi:transcriptional regulator, TetR family [Microbispora rosea]|uniref:Transcriptional regulator, TetR family n=1 Tax=Microbispora rosea TaxID=58117 RepID=A0A1N6WI14_9ACTN|nr:TetR/AcrR family transcriptional regulator [Microbispora rosea]GIH49070.1 TetR family transcriptional regulator [Microbispora rosea subsp. rosea]SIQ89630.1 transcriptional regulator, TetR family [Microbispora rosea]